MIRFVIFFALLMVPQLALADTVRPRTLLAIYDSREEPLARETDLHGVLELPANHMGYFLRYHDIRTDALPALDDDVAGVVVWFNPGVVVKDPETWLNWLKSEVLARQKRLLLFGSLGIGSDFRKSATGLAQINQVMHAIGVHDENLWIDIVYGAQIARRDANMVGFERQLTGQLYPYLFTTLASSGAHSYLTVTNSTEHQGKAELVVTGPQGGYVAYNYAIYRLLREKSENVSLQQWIIDPFAFLQEALGAGRRPIPDNSTAFGRRIAYAQMDGDGWNNYSALLEHRNEKILAAQSALEKIIRPYPDMPFTVGLIGADIDQACYGMKDSERFAALIAKQPNVELANHTYSHIQYWHYFDHGDVTREKVLLSRYPSKPSDNVSFIARLKALFRSDPWKDVAAPADSAELKSEIAFLKEKFDYLPRSYACEPFDLAKEILGNKKLLNDLSPENKPVRLMSWSGDTAPFAAARKAVRDAGMVGLGGGLTRYILDYPSISLLAPYGYVEGSDVQIYSSNGNENVLRNENGDHFSGLRYLNLLARQTETPRRLLPLNLYFHAGDAGDPLSLQAVLENIAYVRERPFVRMTASSYAGTAHQFYQARITELTGDSWKISGLSQPMAVRIPNATRQMVDFKRSKGVWGMRYLQGSLYVQLSGNNDQILALKDKSGLELYPAAQHAYLIESAWPIKSLRIGKSSLIVAAEGYGLGAMRWRVPAPGLYRVRTVAPKGSGIDATEQKVTVGEDGILQFTLVEANAVPLTIHIDKND